MNPYVASALALVTFVIGIWVGWIWRQAHIVQEIKNGEFDWKGE